jgi:hypothetical protein
MSDDFEVLIGSFPDREDFFAEIWYKEEAVLQITQEEGFDSLDLELFPRRDGESWRFKLKDLEASIKRARKRLWETRRNPKDDDREPDFG